MKTIRYTIILFLLFFSTSMIWAEGNETEVRFDFRVKSTIIDSLYKDNANSLRRLNEFLQNVRNDKSIVITSIEYRGSASPEGSSELNRRLARERMNAVETLVSRQISYPQSIVSRDDSYIPWDLLKEMVESSDIQYKDQIIDILNDEPRYVEYRKGAYIDNRVLKLQRLKNGTVWKVLLKEYFPNLRSACAATITYRKEEAKPALPSPYLEPDTVPMREPLPEEEPTITVNEEPDWTRHLYIKTNAIGWAMAATNLAVEIDLAKHWSFTLPFYWSSWNYFKHTLKFRTFTIQPEVRFWLSPNNDGFFAGAHFGLGWYNFATDGDYRIQDHNGENPSTGGGIAVGYRLPLCKSGRWKLEFSLGAGVYSAYYDKFHNVSNGLLTTTHKKTWFGIDQAAVTFCYTFDLKKKEGNK